VKVEYVSYIDDMRNYTAMYYATGDLRRATEEDRKFKEDKYRIEANAGSELIYYIPGRIRNISVNSFTPDDTGSFKILVSVNGEDFTEQYFIRETHFITKGDYNYWIPAQSRVENLSSEISYVKLAVSSLTQIGRVKIDYVPAE